MSSKSDRRIEAKKRKAVAFLELIESEQNVKQDGDKIPNTGCDEPVSKKLKSSEEKTPVTSVSVKTEPGVIKRSDSPVATVTEAVTSGSNVAVCAEGGTGPTQWKDAKSDDVIAAYRKELRERQKAAMQRPKIFLTLDELARDNPVEAELDEVKQVPPLFVTDVQHLLLYSLQGIQSSVRPRWCRLLRVGKVSKVVAVVLESVSSYEFNLYADSLPTLKSAFDIQVELISPLQYGSTVREDILNVPLSMSQLRKQKSYTNKLMRQREVAKEMKMDCKAANVMLENPLQFFKEQQARRQKWKSGDPPQDWSAYYQESTYTRDKFDRTSLLLNTAQLIYESIPMPVDNVKQYGDFVFTKDNYKPVTSTSPMFAVDCEMVQTKSSMMDLARISIVNENLETIYDTFVKPWAPVVNYVTQFSGISKEILDPVTTRLQDIHRHIREILPGDAILCGQSLGSDLRSMKMFHPYVIDTSVVYNLTGNRRMKTGLRRLTAHFLCRSIQDGQAGHSSVEDAHATMELVLLKLRNGPEFGDLLMAAPSMYDEPEKSAIDAGDKNIEHGNEFNKKAIENTETDSCKENSNKINTSKDFDKKADIKVENKKTYKTDEVDNEEDETGENNNEVNNSKEADTKADTDSESSDSDSGDSKNDNASNITKNAVAIQKRSNTRDIIKRRLFFQREGNKFIESFVQRIKHQKKTGTVIDVSNNVRLYPRDLPLITCSTDKDSEKQTKKVLQDQNFCLTHLYGYKNFLKENQGNIQHDEEEKKKCLWKLDRRFWKIMGDLPNNSLLVIVLTGRQENMTIYPAMTFAKVT